MTHRIFRIEDQEGFGLYRYGDFKNSLAARLDMDISTAPNRPAPSTDGLQDGDYYPEEKYGFASPDHLLSWMQGIDPEEIYAAKGQIVVLHAMDITRGGHQVRFHPDKVVSHRVLTVDGFYNCLYSNNI